MESACSFHVCRCVHWVVLQGFLKQSKDMHGVGLTVILNWPWRVKIVFFLNKKKIHKLKSSYRASMVAPRGQKQCKLRHNISIT